MTVLKESSFPLSLDTLIEGSSVFTKKPSPNQPIHIRIAQARSLVNLKINTPFCPLFQKKAVNRTKLWKKIMEPPAVFRLFSAKTMTHFNTYNGRYVWSSYFTVILQIFGVVIFSVFSVVIGFTEIKKKTPI